MDYLTLLIGLLIGAILGFIGNQLFQKIKAEQKEDNDQDDVISEIKALKQEVSIQIQLQAHAAKVLLIWDFLLKLFHFLTKI